VGKDIGQGVQEGYELHANRKWEIMVLMSLKGPLEDQRKKHKSNSILLHFCWPIWDSTAPLLLPVKPHSLHPECGGSMNL
jgi:hypothetical protein